VEFENLEASLKNDTGAFVCRKLDEPKTKKVVPVHHFADPGLTDEQLGQLESELGHICGLVEFFKNYSNLRLLASPESWRSLKSDFSGWIEGIDPEDVDPLPSWIENCCVVGTRPGTGNFFLLATDGEFSGSVFEFEHDGFYFAEISDDFPSFIDHLLTINEDRLSVMASYLRFVDANSSIDQWIISEYKNNVITVALDRQGLGYRLRVFYTENLFSFKEKKSEIAKFDMPPSDSHGCSTLKYVEIALPNKRIIALVCEMDKYGTSLSVSEPSNREISGVRIGGRSLFRVHTDKEFSLQYSVDESTEILFSLAE